MKYAIPPCVPALLVLLPLVSCGGAGGGGPTQPVIPQAQVSVEPGSAPPGALVQIQGLHPAALEQNLWVRFDEAPMPVMLTVDGVASVMVPLLDPGPVTLTVVVGAQAVGVGGELEVEPLPEPQFAGRQLEAALNQGTQAVIEAITSPLVALVETTPLPFDVEDLEELLAPTDGLRQALVSDLAALSDEDLVLLEQLLGGAELLDLFTAVPLLSAGALPVLGGPFGQHRLAVGLDLTDALFAFSATKLNAAAWLSIISIKGAFLAPILKKLSMVLDFLSNGIQMLFPTDLYGLVLPDGSLPTGITVQVWPSGGTPIESGQAAIFEVRAYFAPQKPLEQFVVEKIVAGMLQDELDQSGMLKNKDWVAALQQKLGFAIDFGAIVDWLAESFADMGDNSMAG